MVAAPHPTIAATKMEEERERWAEEDKNGRAPFRVPTPTRPPSQMGPAEKLGWLGALTRNQSEKYSEKYTAKSWSLYSVLVKSWQRKRHQENYFFWQFYRCKEIQYQPKWYAPLGKKVRWMWALTQRDRKERRLMSNCLPSNIVCPDWQRQKVEWCLP